MEVAKEMKFGTKVAWGWGWCPNIKYAHNTEKACDTTLNDAKYSQRKCCNNTQQGAPHTGKQTSACASDLGDGSHVTCSCDEVRWSTVICHHTVCRMLFCVCGSYFMLTFTPDQ